MISELSIENLGIIESAELEFSPRLTVLTGETGAGKTMVLSSLQLLTGGKADTQLVRAGSSELCATATIVDAPQACACAEANGGRSEDGELVITRVVRATRSRAFLGGRPVAAGTLAELGPHWVTIHGQAEQLKLRSESAQLAFLDRFGGAENARARAEYAAAWDAHRKAEAALAEHLREAAKRAERKTFLEQEAELLTQLAPEAGEEEELISTINRLTNVEELRNTLTQVLRQVEATSANGSAAAQLERIADTDAQLLELVSSLRDAEAIYNDAAAELASYLADLQEDPAQLDAAHQRLANLRAALPGRAADVAGLITWLATVEEELAQLAHDESDASTLEIAAAEAKAEAQAKAARLSAVRKRDAKRLGSALDRELRDLAMPDTRITVQVSEKALSAAGADDAAFLMSTTHDSRLRPLAATASGGELSRVMLALEVVCSEHEENSEQQTLIFDEIDAGIGGATALAVGKRLALLAKHRQVIVVTHLAQVACWADTQLLISKSAGKTGVNAVSGEARISEIARMLSGKINSKSARAHAAELLNAANVE